jgi:magnesium and cobalt exporter, CNNM family
MLDILLLLLLILLNGVLSMSEIALVSSRRARLQNLANHRTHGARAALELKNNPSTFLSAIQVGITSVAILSGAIGQSALADPLSAWLGEFSLLKPYAGGIALTIVVAGLTYFSVVIGELVPKQLGLLAPEKISSFIAPWMNALARVASPFVWLFAATSGFVIRLVSVAHKPEPPITDEEIKVLMQQGAEAGVFHVSERAIVSNVLRLDEQRIAAIMTPRNEIYALDLDEPEAVIRRRIAESPYTRIVVCRDGLDNIVGILRTVDLLKKVLANEPLVVEPLLRPPLFMPESVTTTQLLENFRKTRKQFALIVDEYGELQGIVTLTDVMIAIVGDVPASNINSEQDIVERKDHSWLIDGGVSVERMKSTLGIEEALPGEEEGSFNTLGGFAMNQLGRIPVEADTFDAAAYRFEVIDMDKNRVDKMLVRRIIQPGAGFE